MRELDENSLGERIRTRREQLGMTQEELARRAATTQTTIEKIENGKSLRSRFLPAVFSVLKMPLDELAGGAQLPVGSKPVYVPRSELVSARDLPVYASAEGGKGALTINGEPIDWVRRPTPLEHVREGYGVVVTGASMEPVFRQGDIALVHPTLPPRADDAVILYVADRSEAMIKEYRGATATLWRLRRYSPKTEDFTVAKADWPICHTIVGKYSRR